MCSHDSHNKCKKVTGLFWTPNKAPTVQSSQHNMVTSTAALENEWAFNSYISADSDEGGGGGRGGLLKQTLLLTAECILGHRLRLANCV